MKVLVTGANGFIGTNLVKALSGNKNIELYGVYRRNVKLESLNVNKIIADLGKENFTKEFPDEIDCVLHLAQSEAYREFPEKALEIFNINVNATLKLLDWSRKKKVKKFIYFSSGNVYGQQNKLYKENDPLEGFSFYGSSKIIAEKLCENYKSFLDVIILRPFGVYGPNQTGMLIQNIYERLINNSPIYLASGTGLNISLLYIDDCIGIIESFLKISPNKGLSVFNVAGNEILNIKTIADSIGAIVNRTPNYVLEEGEPVYMAASNQKIVEYLKLSPRVPFQDGIRKCFQ